MFIYDRYSYKICTWDSKGPAAAAIAAPRPGPSASPLPLLYRDREPLLLWPRGDGTDDDDRSPPSSKYPCRCSPPRP